MKRQAIGADRVTGQASTEIDFLAVQSQTAGDHHCLVVEGVVRF